MPLKQTLGPSKLGKWGRPVPVSGFTSDHHLNYDIIRTCVDKHSITSAWNSLIISDNYINTRGAAIHV